MQNSLARQLYTLFFTFSRANILIRAPCSRKISRPRNKSLAKYSKFQFWNSRDEGLKINQILYPSTLTNFFSHPQVPGNEFMNLPRCKKCYNSLLNITLRHTGNYGSCMHEVFIFKGRFTRRRQVCTLWVWSLSPRGVAIGGIQIPVHARMHN